MQRVLHPQRYTREKREANIRRQVNDQVIGQSSNPITTDNKALFRSVGRLNSTLAEMQTRFASDKPIWNPQEPKNYALGYAFKKHMTPIVQALVKPGALTEDDKAKLQSMKAVINAKLGAQSVLAPEVAPLAQEVRRARETLKVKQEGGRRKTHSKSKTRKNKNRKTRK